MANYAKLNNADNTVLSVVDWDGIAELPAPGTPEHPIDVTLLPLEGTAVPAIGAVWNGTVFEPPAAEPEPPITRSRRHPQRSDDE